MTNKQHEEETVSDAQALLNHAKENPLMYIGGIGIIIIVGISTVLFQMNNSLKAKDQASVYATAIDIEDPMERMEALGKITEGSSKYLAEALFMQGSAALESEDYETAEVAFTTLRNDHPDFRFTPDGVEGLGAIHERNSDYAEAIAVYTDIQATWPESFAARRQPFNIGRCHEENNSPEEALKAYENQLQTFPGSNVAGHARQKIDELKAEFPILSAAPVLETTTPDTPSDATN